MSAPTGVSIETDRPRALADALGSAPASLLTATGVAAARAELERSLPGDDPQGRDGATLRLDRRRFEALRRRPGAFDVPEAPFRCTPARCRRAIALDALDLCLRGRAPSAAGAVATVLEDAEARLVAPGTGQDIPWWASWWWRLPPGGRAVVQAEAVLWAVQLWTGIDWPRVGGRAVVVTRNERAVVGSAPWCRLEGRVDLRIEAASGGVAQLVVGDGFAPADWMLDLGFPALVSALARGPEAATSLVLGWWPDSGQVRQLQVDDATLVAMARTVASAAGAWWQQVGQGGTTGPSTAVSRSGPRTAGR